MKNNLNVFFHYFITRILKLESIGLQKKSENIKTPGKFYKCTFPGATFKSFFRFLMTKNNFQSSKQLFYAKYEVFLIFG